MSLFHGASFYTSVNRFQDLPVHTGVEIAFAGRSNAGKSSVINTLACRKKLAFVSKTPGRTQQINYFRINTNFFLVDLPGYGFARVPMDMRRHWETLLSKYLQTHEPLLGLVLIMDVRHPLKELDLQMLDWFSVTGKPIHILLTKADKLSRHLAESTLFKVKDNLMRHYPSVSVQLFSSTKAIGIAEANNALRSWIDGNRVLLNQNTADLQ
ncbi:ribosome biogenesis GTP-binding protein YihA/YsxC [Nitrosomonas sp.]|uniref:ribosome biogenesis GTP-binding protein YihA/YsxC n=1 Tax=Nitrosomonas sp. TaxID=42353 RepID=UPI00284376A2|nr:ribosome biogenesis GTP-binding protein YihA/YsxC [Nitrosomonas sp.]MDR4514723.1 ribosome biogenesis GTP-binding protein YihA/YsxC [Nitrosomonas sp.]